MPQPLVSPSFPNIPVKTPDGVAEISHRVRKLGQRHRTVLLLVDGRRSEAQVRHLADQAGAPGELFDELVDLGLIVRGAASNSRPARPPDLTAESERLADSSDLESRVVSRAGFDFDSSLAPLAPSLSLLPDPDSRFDALPAPWAPSSGALPPDDPEVLLRQARRLLMQALRSEAPVSGSLTMLRVSRARSRDDIENLLDEVESRITKPGRELWADELLEQVRELLLRYAVQSMPMPFA